MYTISKRSPTNTQCALFFLVLLSQNLPPCTSYFSFGGNKNIFSCNKGEVKKVTYIDIMTQFSRFKNKNNKAGLLLWDGMRKH